MSKKFAGHILSFLFVFSFFTRSFAYSYKIDDVVFDITGQTQEDAIQREISIDTKTVFEDEESFLSYINKLKQQFKNTRNFEEIEITYSAASPDDDLCRVTLNVKVQDSFHFLAVPYLKFSTSNGFTAKIKLKDTNFIGTMSELNASLDFNWKPDKNGRQFNVFEPELNFEYDYPFKAGIFDMTWINDYKISYKWGEKSPEWEAKTGIAAEYPLGAATLRAEFTQGFFRDFDYRDYDDDIYLSENLKFSTPMEIARIPDHGPVKFVPYVELNYNFDPFKNDGYSGFTYTEINGKKITSGSELMGPVISTGTVFSFKDINWDGNSRNGLSLSVKPVMSYNFASIKNADVARYSLGINMNGEMHKWLERIGFSTRFWSFGYIWGGKNLTGSERFDEYLRGIVDKRQSGYNKKYYQAESPVALIFNFDMPIHIVTTDWENFALTKNLSFMRYLNFDFQISPFIDMALIQTTKERQGYERTFNLKDGFYTAGLEFLVYPEKWKSNIVRASIGYDIGSILFGNFIETSWRNKQDNKKSWYKRFELSIGIGLHY